MTVTCQVEGELAAVTRKHNELTMESEERVKTTEDACDKLEEEKQKLVRQLDERQRYCAMLSDTITSE